MLWTSLSDESRIPFRCRTTDCDWQWDYNSAALIVVSWTRPCSSKAWGRELFALVRSFMKLEASYWRALFVIEVLIAIQIATHPMCPYGAQIIQLRISHHHMTMTATKQINKVTESSFHELAAVFNWNKTNKRIATVRSQTEQSSLSPIWAHDWGSQYPRYPNLYRVLSAKTHFFCLERFIDERCCTSVGPPKQTTGDGK